MAGTFDAEPFYVTGAALVLLGAGAAGWIGARRLGRERATATIGARSVMEDEPLRRAGRGAPRRLPLPPGYIDEPLLPEPGPLQRGPAARAGAHRGDLRAPRAARCSRRPRSCCATRSGWPSASSRGAEADEVLVLPRVLPVRTTAGGGEGDAPRTPARC